MEEIQSLTTQLREANHVIEKQNKEIEQLKNKLIGESQNVKTLQDKIDKLKKDGLQYQTDLEVEEERITNKLLKEIDDLKHKNEEIQLKLSSDDLVKELDKVKQEKVQMEIAMEEEQEFMVNRLSRQLEESRKFSSMNRSPSSSQPIIDDCKERKFHSSERLNKDIPLSNAVTYEDHLIKKIEFHDHEKKALEAELDRVRRGMSRKP